MESNNSIMRQFNALENQRRFNRNAYLISIAVAAAALIYTVTEAFSDQGIWLFLVAAMLGPWLWYKLHRYFFDDIKLNFKKSLFPRLLNDIAPDLSYNPFGGISTQEFNEMKLFRLSVGCETKDFFSGKIDNTDVKFSLIRAYTSNKSALSTLVLKDAPANTSSVTLNGLVMVVNLNRPLNGRVEIRPKGQAPVIYRKLVETTIGDAFFDQHFSVYADDEASVNTILTPTVIKAIYMLYRSRGYLAQINACYAGDRLYFCISKALDFFDPAINMPLTDAKQVKKIRTQLLEITKLVHVLQPA